MKSRVRVEASATIANFGPGYDTFGFCLDQPLDVLELQISDRPGIHLDISEEGFDVPSEPNSNTASVAAIELMRLAGLSIESVGLNIRIMKGIRPGSGLGSSAASAVAAARGAAELFRINDSRKILMASSTGEGASSGAPHLDNVAPCLLGGFTAILDQEKFGVLRISPKEIKVVVSLPEIIVETYEARKLIPKTVPVATAMSHVGWASGIVYAIQTGDVPLMAQCMRDEISVPFRKTLIKGYDIVRTAAISAGALSFSISGSGPALFCLAETNHEAIGEAMVEAFSRANVKSTYFIAKPGPGAKVIASE